MSGIIATYLIHDDSHNLEKKDRANCTRFNNWLLDSFATLIARTIKTA